jgi:Zn-dependent protease
MNLEPVLLNVSLFWLLTTPHEFAHAWAATKLGDDTPRREGRLTLNPLAHADWLGTVILPAVTSLMGAGFLGWGKPVATNPARLRGGLNGLAAVALAGPGSNVVFAILLAAVARLTAQALPGMADYAARGVYLSLYLALFNLLPGWNGLRYYPQSWSALDRCSAPRWPLHLWMPASRRPANPIYRMQSGAWIAQAIRWL